MLAYANKKLTKWYSKHKKTKNAQILSKLIPILSDVNMLLS